MKKIMLFSLCLSIFMLAVPLLALKNDITLDENKTNEASVSAVSYLKAEDFKVFDNNTNKIITMSCEDYLFSVVAAEMPALYEEEALKAQAVAAYSFALRRKSDNRAKDYDITCDPKVDQSFISEEAVKKRWGENADVYTKKIKNAVNSVLGYAATYNGEVALTLYHAISAGKTESAKDIFGGELKYLVSKDSVFDKLSPDYLSSCKKSLPELKKLFSVNDYKGSAKDFIKITEKTKNGTVKKLKIANKDIDADTLRGKLSLRSCNFTMSVENDNIIFSVKGYGHGVGMSQYGANYLAKQGLSYKEILKYYYKDIKIEKII